MPQHEVSPANQSCRKFKWTGGFMNNNNLKKSVMVLAITSALGTSMGASASVDLYNEDGTSFSVDGYFNAFYVTREDEVPDTRDTRIKISFLPNTIGFNFSKDVGDLVLGGAIVILDNHKR